MQLNHDYLNASRLLLPQADRVALFLVGCGGTGSWLAPTVTRVARLLVEKHTLEVKIFFVDPDDVAHKNVYRQNFCDAEVGLPKAESLAFRYGLAWGVPITAICQLFDKKFVTQLPRHTFSLLIGCVDNPAARCTLATATQNAHRNYERSQTWWLDCGNEQSNGQVLLGCAEAVTPEAFALPRFCTELPLPSLQHPELLETEMGGGHEKVEAISCADMALHDSQGLAINQRIAAEAGDVLVRMLLTHNLTRFASYLDLESGVTRSRYITPENVCTP